MRTVLFLLIVTAALALAACSGEQEQQAQAGSCCESAAACADADSIPAPVGKVYGAGVSGGSTLPMAEFLADPASYVGQTVRVQGPVARVCRHAGCWFDFDAGGGDLLRLKVVEGEIVFPISLEGQVAMAQGVVEALPLSHAQSAAYLEAEARRRGQDFDPAAVPAEGMTTYRIMGTGVVVLEQPSP